MSAGKEIRGKIKSVQNTQKITKAMQMVATSKMRKTQERMKQARPYAEKIREVMAHLAQVNPYAKKTTAFLRNPEAFNKVALVVISSDKGLCGGLNSNVIKVFYEKLKQFQDANIPVEICALGQKGLVAANRVKANIVGQAAGLGDVPKMDKIIGPLSGIFNRFYSGDLDAVYVIYSHFVNTMKQQATYEQILPLSDRDLKLDNSMPWDYIYEPDATEVLNELIRRYAESVVYQCLADNMASEQAARMVAMKSATDNAGTAISELRLVYNKSRQAAITKELAEIVSGSAAV